MRTNTKVTQDCFSEENFEKAYHYLEWKLATSKKLSENKQVIFDKYEIKTGNENELPSQIGIPSIIFSQKNMPYFSFYKEKGFVLHIKSPLFHKNPNQLFCELVRISIERNLPKNYVYHYSDGNGNLWTITDNTLQYAPITPSMSSSGYYSGGKPFEKNITEQDFKQIENILQKSLKNTKNPLLNRQKGTGQITKSVTLTVEISSKILSINATEKTEIETWLNSQKP